MQENIHDLMSGYFTGSLTESEHLELKNHLTSDPADRKIFEDYRLLWEESGQKIDLKPIDVESALIKIKLRLFFRKINFVQFLLRTAAIFILAGLFSTAYIYYHYPVAVKVAEKSEPPVILQEISSIYGTRSKFQLSDGTTVFLNSGSKLIFPVEFKGISRKVELIGEAFFEITSDSVKPFIVRAKGITVKALGTAFNLQSYPKSNEISTTVVHGRVVIERESCGILKQLAELKPSDRAVIKIDKQAIDITAEEDLDKYIGWKDGKLVFFNDPIGIVSEKLGNWYNVKVKICNKDLKEYRFTATFTDEPIEQVLDLLSKSSPIRYQIKKASRLPDNSYSKREVILN
ncbi:MAG: DUF4974 domain-containing protein [Bacteroidia bacterium]|nr:DUF4974 domain-containing protein [Bacteroidia bacterium]